MASHTCPSSAIIPIADLADDRLAPYRDIRERDLVRAGDFIAEGETIVRILTSSPRFRPESLLIEERRVDGLLARLPGLLPGTPIYSVSGVLMDRIAGFPVHRGILAIGRRAAAVGADALLEGLGSDALILVLCGLANHDNVGGIFRNAAAFGADAVLLDSQSCDPLYRKALRVSGGASLLVPFARLGPDEDVLAPLARFRFEPLALSPGGEVPLHRLARPPRVALLLGTEGPGLAPALLERARTVSIPMASGFDSLNVATASGIALHHLVHAAPRRETPAT